MELLLYTRSRLVAACALAAVPALDAPFFDVHDSDGLKQEITRSRPWGFPASARSIPLRSLFRELIPITAAIFYDSRHLKRHKHAVECNFRTPRHHFLGIGFAVHHAEEQQPLTQGKCDVSQERRRHRISETRLIVQMLQRRRQFHMHLTEEPGQFRSKAGSADCIELSFGDEQERIFVLRAHRDEELAEALESLLFRCRPDNNRVSVLREVPQAAFDELKKEIILAGEVRIEGAAREAGSLSNLVDGCTGKAATCKGLGRRFEDLVLGDRFTLFSGQSFLNRGYPFYITYLQ